MEKHESVEERKAVDAKGEIKEKEARREREKQVIMKKSEGRVEGGERKRKHNYKADRTKAVPSCTDSRSRIPTC